MRILINVLSLILLFTVTMYKCNFFKKIIWNEVEALKDLIKLRFGWLCASGYIFVLLILHFVLEVSYENILYIDLFLSLIMLSVIDIKHKIVPNSLNAAALISQMIIRFVPTQGKLDIMNLVFSFAVLLILVIISKCTGEQLGMGDIKLFAVMMIIYGFSFMMYTLLIGMILVMVLAIPLMLGKKITIKTSVPFIPFYTIGILIYVMLILGGKI